MHVDALLCACTTSFLADCSGQLQRYRLSMHGVVVLTQKPTDEPFWKDVVPFFRQLSQKELQMFPGRSWEHGWKYITLVCDSQLYLRYLNQKFHEVCILSSLKSGA